jgi:hypothetical protein
VCNSDDFAAISPVASGDIQVGKDLLKLQA